jgi:YidC/Oxa1 family membrane protein insertase
LVELWNLVFFEPILNLLILLYSYLSQNFGVTIIIFTILIRLVTLPLTMKQLRSSKAMSTLQPKIQELQKKHAKDRQRLSQETMRLYKEQGVNPMGCLGPMIIQLPIWIAVYQAVIRGLGSTPESLLELSKYLYSWPVIHRMIPLHPEFLWLNLAQPDTTLVLPLLVAGSMWLQQKMMPVTGGPQQQSMNTMMLWFMPLMFGLLTMQFPAGLAIYWVASNAIGIFIQYRMFGWGGLTRRQATHPRPAPPPKSAPPPKAPPPPKPAPPPQARGVEERIDHAEPRDERQDRGGGDQAGPGETWLKPRRGRSRRRKKR